MAARKNMSSNPGCVYILCIDKQNILDEKINSQQNL